MNFIQMITQMLIAIVGTYFLIKLCVWNDKKLDIQFGRMKKLFLEKKE